MSKTSFFCSSSPINGHHGKELNRNQTVLPNQTQLTNSFYSWSKDITETIRKRIIKFLADGTQSIQKFLEDIGRRTSLLSVTFEELLLIATWTKMILIQK